METKELANLIQSAADELHKAVERQDAEIKAFGAPLEETKATIAKINERIDQLEIKLQRGSIPVAGSPKADSPESKALAEAFYKFVKQGEKSLTPEEQKALVEDTTGQYIVEPELEAEIMRSLPKITVVRDLATIRKIASDRLKIRSISEVAVGWGKLETGSAITELAPVPGEPTYQYVEDLYGLAKIGEDELADANVDLQALLADSFSRVIAEAEDKAFMIGTGHTLLEPEGITINPTLLTACETTAAANAVSFEDLLKMIYACPTQYRKNGVFIMSSSLELFLRQIRATTYDATHFGAFIWQPSVQEGKPNTLLGYPVYTQGDMKDLSNTAEVIAVFGDMKAGYRIIDRGGIALQRLTELYAEAGLVGFKVHKRVGGGVQRASQKPIILLKEHA